MAMKNTSLIRLARRQCRRLDLSAEPAQLYLTPALAEDLGGWISPLVNYYHYGKSLINGDFNGYIMGSFHS